MPCEGTETNDALWRTGETAMHPMPREGTETWGEPEREERFLNASYAP